MAKKVHVVPHPDGWAVKREGNDRATSVHDTQKQAQDAAIPIAKRDHTEVVTHGRDGKIRDSDSYGNRYRNTRRQTRNTNEGRR